VYKVYIPGADDKLGQALQTHLIQQKKQLGWTYFNENFRKSLYAYYKQIYSIKYPLASTTASIRERNFLQAGMTTSLPMSAITYEILALREARVLLGCSFTSLSTALHIK